MKSSRPFMLVAAWLCVTAGVASAHHSYYNVYDPNKSITISGTVREFRFVNPHAMLYLDVTDAAGKVTKWTVEFDGVLNMSEGGWTATTIKPKEAITITGNPTREGGDPRMFFLQLRRADGTEIKRYYNQRLDAVEEARRKRAEERSKQQQPAAGSAP